MSIQREKAIQEAFRFMREYIDNDGLYLQYLEERKKVDDKYFLPSDKQKEVVRTDSGNLVEIESDFNPRPWLPVAEYYIAGKFDIRDVIQAFQLNFNRGAVVKYMIRAGKKPGNKDLMDLYKAREHLNREIEFLEKGNKNG